MADQIPEQPKNTLPSENPVPNTDAAPTQNPEVPAEAPVSAPIPEPQQPVYVPSFLQPAPVAPGVVPKTNAAGTVPAASPAAAPVAGTKIANTAVAKGRKVSGPWAVAGCFGFFAFLFVLFVGVLILGYNTNSSIFSSFGLSTQDMPRILSTLVSTSFGLFTGIFLIIAIISLFRLLLAKKDEKHTKRTAFWAMIISFVVVIFSIIAWVAILSTIRAPRAITQAENTPIILAYKNEATGEFEPLLSTIDLEAPMEVQFTVSDQVLPSETDFFRIKKYQWDLDGDGKYTGAEGTGRTVNYTYTNKGFNGGLYNVKMQATIEFMQPYQGRKAGEILEETYGPGSENGGVSLTFTKIRPTLKIVTTPDILSGPVPFKVDFDASNTLNGVDIRSLEWDMDNDGTFEAAGAKQSRTFEQIGKYKVAVRAINGEGATSTKIFQVDATDTQLPKAFIEADPIAGTSPLTVELSGAKSTTPQGRIVEYTWDFGDGSATSTGVNADHIYRKAGKYTVKLSIKTDLGTTADTTQLISIETAKGAPTARIRVKSDSLPRALDSDSTSVIRGNIPLSLTLDGSFSTDPENDIVDWKWDFDGDKKFDKTGKDASFIYKTPGNFILTLQVTDSAGNSSEATMNVEVNAEDLTAIINADPLAGEAPLAVAFDASGSSYSKGSIGSYVWDFGDGTAPQITGAQITHEFQSPGNYIVKLTVRTTDGTKTETTQAISVLEEQLLPIFTVSPESGQAPVTMTFDGSLSKGKIISYRWDFGDGTAANEVKPVHRYNKAGNYDVTLRVQDKNGNVQMTKKSVSVK
ncbi:MAG: PKD domain-containing protein [Candidatus Gracilibacteria bacterium]